jgi:hypothetical protein
VYVAAEPPDEEEDEDVDEEFELHALSTMATIAVKTMQAKRPRPELCFPRLLPSCAAETAVLLYKSPMDIIAWLAFIPGQSSQ